MVYNKRGQTLMMSIITAIFIFIIGFIFVNFIMTDVTTFRTAMDCNNASISDGSKLTCLMGDSVVIYTILILLSSAGGIIISRLV